MTNAIDINPNSIKRTFETGLSADLGDDIRGSLLVYLTICDDSSAGDVRLFASLEPLPGHTQAYGPRIKGAFDELLDDLVGVLELDYVAGEQCDDDQVEIGLDPDRFDEIAGYPAALRSLGWTVDAGGFMIDEDDEAR